MENKRKDEDEELKEEKVVKSEDTEEVEKKEKKAPDDDVYIEYDEDMDYDENEYEVIEVDEDEYNKMTGDKNADDTATNNIASELSEEEAILADEKEPEEDEEEEEEIEVDRDGNVIEKPKKVEEDEEDEEESNKETQYPDELTDLRLECLYIGLLFLNPKSISRFFFLFPDCHFSDKRLLNLYKTIIYREGEAYASAKAKAGYNLPIETPESYDLTQKLKRFAKQDNFDIEKIYIELKKLFILKKFYIVAPTSQIQEKILEIRHYKLYEEMTVEEVESAIEQIGVTNRLSQVVLNANSTEFLLAGDTSLANGISIPFPILNKVFKGLRLGETICYAMPSNSGKSRFTTFLAAQLALVHGKKVLIISNEMSEEKIKFCMITTVINNVGIQNLHKQFISKRENELLEFHYKADDPKKSKVDERGFILRKKDESLEDFITRLHKESKEFNQTIAVTNWLNEQIDNCIHFIHITEHSNDDLKKIIMNYYYKYSIEYVFYDTLKAEAKFIGNSDEVKKTATLLSNIAQKFNMFIASSMQLLESSTLPVNLTVNDMSASTTVKEVLDTLMLVKQITRQTIHNYEYSDTDTFEKCYEIEVPKDTDVRFYACVVDKNRAGAKPTVLFRLNLAYNIWEELGYLRLKTDGIAAEDYIPDN